MPKAILVSKTGVITIDFVDNNQGEIFQNVNYWDINGKYSEKTHKFKFEKELNSVLLYAEEVE